MPRLIMISEVGGGRPEQYCRSIMNEIPLTGLLPLNVLE